MYMYHSALYCTEAQVNDEHYGMHADRPIDLVTCSDTTTCGCDSTGLVLETSIFSSTTTFAAYGNHIKVTDT